ncbi:MAG: 4'-phosphopantetheinyl transferase superfamily protein [Betaproteobacteria bacterium]|nr:4'-phosphopantetheinyl transferase superfamily protein [Betaproteobacteria bacterium]
MNHTGNDPFSEIAQPPQRLPVGLAGVSLWRATLAQPEAVIAPWRAWLTPEELRRADHLARPALRPRAVAVRALLRGVLAQELDTSPAALRFQTDAHGRPFLAPPFAKGDAHDTIRDFNLSHSGDGLLIGILRHTAPPSHQRIGVDLESLQRPRDTARLTPRVLSANEQRTMTGLSREEHQRRFLRFWVLKEAFSKAVGAGFSLGFDAMDFDIDATTPVIRALPEPHRPEDWTLRFLPVDPLFVAAVAVGQISK